MQDEVVKALLNPEAYDVEPGKIQLIQTHISFIFLTEKFVYKVKKAVNLGFLDFTTLEKRRYYCEKELELNRRLCEDMYLEVVTINRSNGSIKIKGKGQVIEYAVKMRRFPQERMMSRLLEENKVDMKIIDKIAKTISDFHSKAETNERINQFGSLKIIEANWKENFDQTKEFIGITISYNDFNQIYKKVYDFMDKNVLLFEKRVNKGKIRD
ncbi:TPA: kinase, partial [Candidatus Bathyarchaeota archaeon]|nr:kinase [Candidatus Bathyarchaeota archaeon]